MQALNQTERRKAFLNFLIFFTITAVLIIATVLFSIDVPFRENDQLNEYKENAEKEKDFSEKFLADMKGTMRLLDSLNDKEANVDLIGTKIEERLRGMDAMIDKDSLAETSLYAEVMNNLSQLYTAKKELKAATNADDTQTELKQQVIDLKGKLDRCENKVEIYEILRKRD